jgi:hypothetical protein
VAVHERELQKKSRYPGRHAKGPLKLVTIPWENASISLMDKAFNFNEDIIEDNSGNFKLKNS